MKKDGLHMRNLKSKSDQNSLLHYIRGYSKPWRNKNRYYFAQRWTILGKTIESLSIIRKTIENNTKQWLCSLNNRNGARSHPLYTTIKSTLTKFMAHCAVWGHSPIQRQNRNSKKLTIEKLSKSGLRRSTKFRQTHSNDERKITLSLILHFIWDFRI